jgi:hypothetical protein
MFADANGITWRCKLKKFICLTFNNISAISWRSVVLVEETGEPRENHRHVASHWQTLSYNVVHLALMKIRSHNITDYIGSCKSNYHTITATTVPERTSKIMIQLQCNTVICITNIINRGLWCLTPLSTIYQLYRGGNVDNFRSESNK